jgi:DNA-binding MarR family transcriptional regulator
MNLTKFATATRILEGEGIALADLYVLAEYYKAKVEGDVTIMALGKGMLLSKTVMLRRIKKLVDKGVLAKVEKPNDLRLRLLTDGARMAEIVEFLEKV